MSEDTFWGWLTIVRKKLADCYAEMMGERPGVTFDFELVERDRQENAEAAFQRTHQLLDAITETLENPVNGPVVTRAMHPNP